MSSLQCPFTPQRSPTQPASVSSSASSASSGGGSRGDDREGGGGGDKGTKHDKQRQTSTAHAKTSASPASESVSASPPSSPSSLPSSWGALRGWTAHQSHGQATILFYVPRWTRREQLHIVIGGDYVVAGVQGEQPVLKARLAGRIDPVSSAWQLEKRSSKRYRSRSRSRTRTRARSSDQSSGGGSSGSGTDLSNRKNVIIASAAAAAATTAGIVSSSHTATGARAGQSSQQRSREASTSSKAPASLHPRQARSREPSRPISPVHSDSSGFDMLARSTDTLGSTFSAASRWTTGGESVATPSRLRRSTASSSDGSGEADADARSHSTESRSGSGSGSAGVRSLESSVSVEPSLTSSGGGRRRTHEDDEEDHEGDDANDPTRDAKLVTLHLDKVDGGIWPCIVIGPVPTKATQSVKVQPPQRSQSIAQLISQRSQTSLNAALNEALLPFHGGSTHRRSSSNSTSDASSNSEYVRDDELGDEGDVQGGDSDGSAIGMINESTATVDTVGSDDSTTVLGVRHHQAHHDEEQYNMDPISLTLLALQHARRSTTTPFGSASARDDVHAFECFRRAWREGEVPVATERLVHDYLPLHHPTTSSVLAPYRQRLIAGLGGPTAVARLYVSYAHLQMPSYEHSRPLLSLPMSGVSNNPFGTQSIFGATGHHKPSSSSATSPRLDISAVPTSESEGLPPGPLQYLLEARKLDANVIISDADWREAQHIDDERVRYAAELSASSPAATGAPWSGAVSPSARSTAAESVFDSDPPVGASGTGGKARVRRSKRHKAGGGSHRQQREHHKNGHNHGRPLPGTATGESVIYLVVSRAALLSVMVAGGMAVAGWWRRAAAAGSGG